MHRNSSTVSLKQQRIAELARQSPQMGFTSLAYHLDLDWLREAYRRGGKEGHSTFLQLQRAAATRPGPGRSRHQHGLRQPLAQDEPN